MGPGQSAYPPPETTLIPPRPSLCQAGAGCIHYHRLEVQADAAEPQAMELRVTLPRESRFARPGDNGRTIVRSLPMIHHEIHHYCYPMTGIEIVLGDAPVVKCSRYVNAQSRSDRPPAVHLQAVSAWEENYQRLQTEAAEFDQMLNDALYGKESR